MDASKALANALSVYIVNPIIALLFAAGLVVFVWGVVRFMGILSFEGGDEDRKKGKKHMMYGLIGMFVMLASYAIFRMLVNLVGASSTFRL